MIKKNHFAKILFLFAVLSYFYPCSRLLAQDNDLEFNLDTQAATVPLPAIYKPNIDLSGRGVSVAGWPQSLASKELLEAWQKDIGFSGFYRIQYNLWEINELSKNKEEKKKVLDAYENIIRAVSDSGGTVILDIFGTPAGLGRVMDKKSAPTDLEAFKKLIKETIQDLSCNKKYNIWYEVWNAPDLDDFFLGRQQEYFNLYKCVASAAKELEEEAGINIPVGGPSLSWWYHSLEPNTILTPERSLIYALIRYCYANRLPLDFISWHAYSTDPYAEQEITLYHKYAVSLVRDWLSYFRFDRSTPLVIDEWNFDRDSNILAERKERSYISASYIPARIRGMLDAGINNQVFFALEDFRNRKEPVVRNIGAFDNDHNPKAAYNVFRMLGKLGKNMFVSKGENEFCKMLSTKSEDGFVLLIYNYIDPDAARNYLSRNMAKLNAAERKALIGIVKTDKLGQIISGEEGVQNLHLPKKLAELLLSARELGAKAKKYSSESRNIKINIRNLKSGYIYQLYSVDQSCSPNCLFLPKDEKDIASGDCSLAISVGPYSVNMVILKEKPKPEEPLAINQEAAEEKKAEKSNAGTSS